VSAPLSLMGRLLSVAAVTAWVFPVEAQEPAQPPPAPPPLVVVVPPDPAPETPPPAPPVYGEPPQGTWYLPPPPPPVVALDQADKPRIAWRLEGGATFLRLYDIPISGGEGTVALGAEFPGHLALYGSFTTFGGVQETGLGALHVQLAFEAEAKFGRFRIGGGGSFGDVSLWRATSSENTDAPTFGVLARTSVDLLQWGPRDSGGFYLQAKLRAQVAVALDAAPLLWGPTLGVGVRF
jgi:hypothetical protein